MRTEMQDDRVERELREFLDWQADELLGAPSVQEMTDRIVGQLGVKTVARVPSRQMLVVLAVLALVLVAVIVALAAGAKHEVVVVVTPSGSPSGPTPQAITGRCAVPTEFVPAHDVIAKEHQDAHGPANGLVAFAAPFDNTGAIWLQGGAADGERTVATFTWSGEQAPDARVLGWSSDGRSFLVDLTLIHIVLAGPNCSNLYLVAADGSSIVRLTDNGPDQGVIGATLAPNGHSVAFVAVDERGAPAAYSNALEVVEPSGIPRVLASGAPCGAPLGLLNNPGAMVWSPDSQQLAIACDSTIIVYSLADATSRTFQLPSGLTSAAISWSGDANQIVIAAANAGSSQLGPLSILSIDRRDGTITILARSSASVEWAIPFQALPFSPDGAWVLASGGATPGRSFQEALYLVNVATGATRMLFVPQAGPPEAVWLPDSSAVVILDGAGGIVRIPLNGGKQVRIGSTSVFAPDSTRAHAWPGPGAWYWTGG